MFVCMCSLCLCYSGNYTRVVRGKTVSTLHAPAHSQLRCMVKAGWINILSSAEFQSVLTTGQTYLYIRLDQLYDLSPKRNAIKCSKHKARILFNTYF
jgi:hypothetical protein